MSTDSPNLEEVYDAILGLFKDAWEAGTPPITGGPVPPVEWPDEPTTGTPLADGTVPWARVTLRHTDRRVSSIGALPGQTRVDAVGIVRVNVFVVAGKRGLVESAQLGKVALDAFEGQRAGAVWFTDVTPREVGLDGSWYQFDVTATFHYDNHR